MTTTVKTAPEAAAESGEHPADQWPQASIAALLAHPGNARPTEADPELTASIAENGVEDPLHIVALSDGTPQVIDGFRRIAAARAAGLESVPYSPLPLVRVSALVPHKGNLRKGLRLTKEFVASIRAEGVQVPLIVTPGLLVIDGHRRLAGAIQAKRTHVPVERKERAEAQQRLDMLTTAVHRAPLTEAEQIAGLFDAAEFGASTAQIAAASGRTQKAVKAVVKAGGAASVRKLREAVPAVALTLDQVEELAGLDDEEATLAKLAEAATKGENLTYVIRNMKLRREADQEAAAHLAELQAAGARIREADELSERASSLYSLRDEHGKGFTDAWHAANCRGAVWVRYGTNGKYSQVCVNPGLYKHRIIHPNEGAVRKTPAEKAANKAGNLDWEAATDARREWLRALFAKGRKYTAAETAALQKATVLALLSSFGSVTSRFADHRTLPTLGELLGLTGSTFTDETFVKLTERASAARLVALGYAKLAACGEMDATREAWREDGGSRRTKTREHLRLLVSLGYTPVAIEQAVLDGKPYTPQA
ncbi:ParB/RepB/Spo0J family partition protein [Kitasatospora sp. NPDC059160]|uniref:ParB/RepB/Spo0J family partition protein n=1 Tax=Kitasatospora sp. NPDC059160 TaxID=3346748 RepID=UPI00369C0C2E